jgi:hypothetical protein
MSVHLFFFTSRLSATTIAATIATATAAFTTTTTTIALTPAVTFKNYCCSFSVCAVASCLTVSAKYYRGIPAAALPPPPPFPPPSVNVPAGPPAPLPAPGSLSVPGQRKAEEENDDDEFIGPTLPPENKGPGDVDGARVHLHTHKDFLFSFHPFFIDTSCRRPGRRGSSKTGATEEEETGQGFLENQRGRIGGRPIHLCLYFCFCFFVLWVRLHAMILPAHRSWCRKRPARTR